MEPTTLAEGLARDPKTWMLVLALFAVGYLYKERSASQKELLDSVMRQESAHRETLSKIIPMTEKLLSAIEALERITDGLMRGDK
jgi:hypothetical protein